MRPPKEINGSPNLFFPDRRKKLRLQLKVLLQSDPRQH